MDDTDEECDPLVWHNRFRQTPPPPPLGPQRPRPPMPVLSVSSSSPQDLSNEKAKVLFQLTHLVEEDKVEELSTLFEEDKNAHANSVLSFGIPVLLKAVRSGSLRVVDFLLENKADPLSSIHYLMCPIAINAVPKCTEILLKLLPYLDGSVLKHTEGKNLLYRSASCPDLSIFEYLLEQGIVFSHHDAEIVVRLIQHPDHPSSLRMVSKVFKLWGQEICLTGTSGFHLLKQCVIASKLDIFRLLLGYGADPMYIAPNGLSLMYHGSHDPDIILFLHDLGLNVNSINAWGLKPCEEGLHLKKEMLLMLVQLGQQINERQLLEFESYVEDPYVMMIYQRMKNKEFHPMRLKMMCQNVIRRHIWKTTCGSVGPGIWTLPLPVPLLKILDVRVN